MFQPNERYRYAYKLGMSGADVWCIQVALNAAAVSPQLVTDGSFGPHTKVAVEQIQSRLGIETDGVCGPETQHKLCAREAGIIQKGRTPKGLLLGICDGESGSIIPATSGLYGNGSRDYGPYQDNKTNPSEAELKVAYSVNQQTRKTADEISAVYKRYRQMPGGSTDEKAWRLAVLYHNWPAAAEKIAKGEGNTWTYQADGRSYKMSDPAQWIKNIGVAGVTTGWQWAEFYIDKKIVYVTSWTVV